MSEIGHNNPPRHEAFAMALDEVRLEAGNFLDGAPIENQGQADKIGVIVSTAKRIKKDADAARKEDKEPHLEAGRKVDADYKPVLDTADDIIKAAQKPLTDYLNKLAAEQREAEAKAREEAARKAQEAIEASRAAEGSVEAVERARELEKEADKAAKEAAKAGKAKAHVAGMDRAIGLRTYQIAEVTDYAALLKFIKQTNPDALKEWLDEYARKALPSQLPGVTVRSERRVA